jgi:hypothetical protein
VYATLDAALKEPLGSTATVSAAPDRDGVAADARAALSSTYPLHEPRSRRRLAERASWCA